MANSKDQDLETNLMFAGFALNDCVVEVDRNLVKYLKPIHRSALEIAVHSQFGSEIGGFWLAPEQINQLRKLPSYYPPCEAPLVAEAIEAYLRAQLQELYWIVQRGF